MNTFFVLRDRDALDGNIFGAFRFRPFGSSIDERVNTSHIWQTKRLVLCDLSLLRIRFGATCYSQIFKQLCRVFERTRKC